MMMRGVNVFIEKIMNSVKFYAERKMEEREETQEWGRVLLAVAVDI